MISTGQILAAALVTALSVGIAGWTVRWPRRALLLASAGAFALILAWRGICNLLGLNGDFLPAVSIGDTGCLVVGAVAPLASAGLARVPAARRLVPAAVAGLAGVLLLAGVIGCASPVGPASSSSAAAVPGYRVVRDVQLPGNTSRWDYQVYDRGAHRLYVAHLGANEIVAFDTRRQQVAGVVKGVSQVHGLVLATDLGRLYASATGTNQVAVIDTSRLAVVATIPTGNYPGRPALLANLANALLTLSIC